MRTGAKLARVNLEDHLGDVLLKARTHGRISAEAAAQAAGLNATELAALENSGVPPAGANLAGLASCLGLAPAKVDGLARGWRPAAVEVGRWRELRPITTDGGAFSVNCYLVWDEVTRDAALFDTGFDATPVFELIDREALQLRHLFITHGHPDHVAGVEAVRARFPKARLHFGARLAPVEQRNRANDFIHLGSLRITNRETPGHAEDATAYLIGNWPEDAPHVAIVGDALFAGSMGKVPRDAPAAREVIRRQILSLPADTLLCPGHGPLTTVGEETEHNPFF